VVGGKGGGIWGEGGEWFSASYFGIISYTLSCTSILFDYYYY